MKIKPVPLRFYIPGPPVGLEHEGGKIDRHLMEQIAKDGSIITKRKGHRFTNTKTKDYKWLCGWYARKAIVDNRQQEHWPYEGDVWMDVEIYYTREYKRPDPENVIAILQDGFTGVLWKNDRNVLGRPNYHWWPAKNTDRIPPVVFENADYKRKYIGGVCLLIRKVLNEKPVIYL